MTWDVTDLGFRMGLSPQVPAGARRSTSAPLVDDLLARHGLTRVRCGRLGGASRAGRASWTWSSERARPAAGRAGRVPRRAGRARQLLVADGAADPGRAAAPARPPPQRVVMLAFGPGLTLYAALLVRY